MVANGVPKHYASWERKHWIKIKYYCAYFVSASIRTEVSVHIGYDSRCNILKSAVFQTINYIESWGKNGKTIFRCFFINWQKYIWFIWFYCALFYRSNKHSIKWIYNNNNNNQRISFWNGFVSEGQCRFFCCENRFIDCKMCKEEHSVRFIVNDGFLCGCTWLDNKMPRPFAFGSTKKEVKHLTWILFFFRSGAFKLKRHADFHPNKLNVLLKSIRSASRYSGR